MSSTPEGEEDKCKPKEHRYVQTHKPKLRKARRCDVTVQKVSNLDGGWFNLDTPDAYVELECPQTAEKLLSTEVVLDQCNPVFNETKTFTVTGENPMLDIKVKESNYLADGVHGAYRAKLETTPNKFIPLEGGAGVTVDIACRLEPPDLRGGSDLCDGEKEFCKARLPHVRKALQNLLGDHVLQSASTEEIPNIAILGSGGGFRALTAMSGAFRALKDTGILDCVTYMVGLSGSSWYLSALCSHRQWPNIHPALVEAELRENVVNSSMWDTILSLKTVYKSYTEKQDSPWTLTDLFGHWIGQTLIPNRMDSRWSDVREKVQNGLCPLPFLSCVHADEDTSTKQFHEWLEISPFEVYMPKYGTAVKMDNLGSEFYKGKMTKEKEELPLHYLMGICGSGFTALHKSFTEMSAKSRKLARTSRGSDGDWNTSGVDDGTMEWIDSVKGILDTFGWNVLDDRTGRAAQVHNFMRQLTLEQIEEVGTPIDLKDSVFSKVHEPMDTKQDYLCLIDAGLAYNSPYPVILRASRKVDLIISFEFSDRGKDETQPFEELLLAKEWADVHHVPFPPIDVDQYKDRPVEELYVFQDECDPVCPVILHFVLVNNHFRNQYATQGTCPSGEDRAFANFSILDDGVYDSINFDYTETQFNRLSKLMEFNVLHCLDRIKESFLACIQRQKMGSASDSVD